MFLKKTCQPTTEEIFRCPKITTVRDNFGDVAVDKTVSGQEERF
jgi:hypothetical protein